MKPAEDPAKLLVSWVSSGQVEIALLGPRRVERLRASYPAIAASVSDGRLEQSLSLDHHNNVAFIQSSFAEAPEVYLGPLGEPAIRSRTTTTRLKPLWGKSASIHWTSDSFPVQGWLLYPAHYDPAKKYPLIVSVHGGP